MRPALRIKIPEGAALGLLILLSMVNVYRACSSAITIDEARTYLAFVQPPLRQVLSTYEANHHVLNSLMCKASVGAFGLSELTLRIPGLLGGFLYFAMIFVISRQLFGPGWLMLLAVSLLALNPFVLDLCSMARGYSLALGLYLGAWYLVSRSPLASGALLGLCLGANLAFVVPVLALNILAGKRALMALVPEVVIAAAINGGPLAHAAGQEFYLGYGSIFESLKNFAVSSLWEFAPGHNVWRTGVNFFGWLYPVFRFAIFGLIGLIVVMLARRRLSQEMFLFGAATLVSIAILIALHRVLRMPYPVARTAIYFWPLLIFSGCLLIKESWRVVSVVYLAFFLALIAQFALHLTTEYYGGWLYDSGSKRIANFIHNRPLANRDLKITASWALVSSLNFYRKMYSITAWKPVEGRFAPLDTSGDYVVIDMYTDEAALTDFERIYADPLSGAKVLVHKR